MGILLRFKVRDLVSGPGSKTIKMCDFEGIISSGSHLLIYMMMVLNKMVTTNPYCSQTFKMLGNMGSVPLTNIHLSLKCGLMTCPRSEECLPSARQDCSLSIIRDSSQWPLLVE